VIYFPVKQGHGIENIDSRPSAAGRGGRAAMDGNLLRVLNQYFQFHDRIQSTAIIYNQLLMLD